MSRVVVFGNAAMDLVQRVAHLPRPGETLLSRGIERCPGGKGLNQAVAAARTGAATRLVATVGRDADGASLRDFAARELGLETAWIETEAPTDVSVILVADDGENVVVSSAASARALGPADAAAALDCVQPGDVVLVQGNCAVATTLAALDIAAARQARSLLNAAPMTEACRRGAGLATIVVANQGEAELLSGHTGTDATLALRSARTEWAIVTRGGADVIAAGPAGLAHYPVPRIEPLDTAGAGDVFCGTLAGMLASGAAMPDAIRTAVRAAGLSVVRRGTTPSFPTRNEIRAILAAR